MVVTNPPSIIRNWCGAFATKLISWDPRTVCSSCPEPSSCLRTLAQTRGSTSNFSLAFLASATVAAETRRSAAYIFSVTVAPSIAAILFGVILGSRGNFIISPFARSPLRSISAFSTRGAKVPSIVLASLPARLASFDAIKVSGVCTCFAPQQYVVLPYCIGFNRHPLVLLCEGLDLCFDFCDTGL